MTSIPDEALAAYVVHPNDFMLHFAFKDGQHDWRGVIDTYLASGKADADLFASAVRDHLGFSTQGSFRILEFASGFGRVSRHLGSLFPNASIDVADVHLEAVQFVKERLGVTSLLSARVPEEFKPQQPYDIIFCLSFFTHMPHETFGRWIASLYRALDRGGYLMFTTAGRKSLEISGYDVTKMDGKIASFIAKSEQHDLPGTDYGSMFVTPQYAIQQIWEHTRAPIALYRRHFWWDCQDLWAITKP